MTAPSTDTTVDREADGRATGATGDDGDGGPPSLREGDPASLAIGALIGLAGALTLAQPLGAIELAGRAVQPIVLSMAVTAVGFGLGAAVYLGRGRRRLGLVHLAGAVGLGAITLATGLGSVILLVVGLGIVLGGAAFVATRTASDPARR